MISKLVLAVVLLLFQPAQANSQCLHNCATTDTGLELIEGFEGFSPFIYNDIAGIPTIGFGHAIKRGERFSEPLMPPEARTLLENDLRGKERAINGMVCTPLTDNQFDALASFTYNLGEGTLRKSSVLRYINAGTHGKVPPRIRLYDRAAGVEVKGLYLRRKAEANLYSASK